MTTPREASFISCVKTMRSVGDPIVAMAKHDPATGEHWFAFPTVPASREGTMFLAVFREGGVNGQLVMCPGGDYLLRGEGVVDIAPEVLAPFKAEVEELLGAFQIVEKLTPGYKTERTIVARDFYTLAREEPAKRRDPLVKPALPPRKPHTTRVKEAVPSDDTILRTKSITDMSDFN